jgi:hypothetical protein
MFLIPTRVGAKGVGLVEYPVGSDLRHDGLRGPVVVTRCAEVIAPAVGTGYVAVEVDGGAAYYVG